MTPAPTYRTPDTDDYVWVLGDQVRFLGTVDERDLHVVDVTVPPGSGTPPHRHPSIEIFRVAEGQITFALFGDGPPRLVTAGPGAVLTIPAGFGHNYQNSGATPARMTAVIEGQMRDFFRDVGALAPPPPGPPSPDDLARVIAACGRHGIELLAPT